MLPFSTLHETLDSIIRFACVYALIITLFVLDVIVFPVPFDGAMLIPFMPIVIFYWAIFRPAVISPVLMFCLGLLFDMITGGPLGFSAIIFVVMRWGVLEQRAFLMAQPFLMLWMIFSMMLTVLLLFRWGVYGVIRMQWEGLVSILPELGVGCITFPMITAILHLSHKLLPYTAKTPLSSRPIRAR